MKFNNKIKISNKVISNKRCFIVAEISANHCGKLSILKKIIKDLKNSGVDAIKIQAYEASTITLNNDHKDFKIKKNNAWSKYKTLYDLYKEAQTPFSWYSKIFKFCKKNNIIIFASIFDEKSLNTLEKLNCPAYKIASPEITDIPLIEKIAKTKKPIIISNGLATLTDLSNAVKAVKKYNNKNLILLKCTSSYPTPPNEVNLLTMNNMSKKFSCLTGFSDHTNGYNLTIHAASMGASMIEKHVMLKNKKSIDGFFSLDTKEFKKMIEIIRNNEIATGTINYNITKSSKVNLNGRRSIYVIKNVNKGEKFTNKNIRSIRPSFGMHPKYYNSFLNKKSVKFIKAGSRLKWEHIKK